MAEELVMTVKSNIKSVTKDSQDLNSTLAEQKKILMELKQEEIKLNQQRSNMSSWQKSITGVDKKIEHLKHSIKDQTLAVKGMTEQQREANKALSTTGKESKESIANFKFMGVSLNGVKKGFKQVIPTAKAMFGTIRAGMMSTGIGALVIGVMALIQSFKRSEEGQEKFQKIMAAIGAVTSQVLDLFAGLGETIIEAVTSPMKALKSLGNGIVKFLKDPLGTATEIVTKTVVAMKTLVDETKKEVDALVEVTKARQKAHHIDRKLKVERAKANREINDIRLQAEDREKNSATERIALLRKAQAIEESITAKEIQSKQILINAQKLEMEQGLNTIAEKDKLAQLQADLINLDTKKLRSQRLLQTQITTAVNEEKAIKEQKKIDDQQIIDDEFDAKIEANDEWNKIQAAQYDKDIADAKKVSDSKKLIAEKLEETKTATLEMGAAAAMKIAGEGSAIGKSVAVAMAIMNTKEAVTAALGATPYGPWNIAQAVATGIFGMTQVQDILSTPIPGGGGGGGSAGGGMGAVPQTPAPQMMSGAFELGGGVAPEPVKAFVVTDEMTNSQNQLANIRRRATI
tara:strand:- start:422 stop:2143 length:1722 start_codon:yes stop_codon:yes gene_type:complete